MKPGGPIVLTTSSAEFQILPSGYIQASLLKGDQRLTLDQPGAGGSDRSGAEWQTSSICTWTWARPRFRTVRASWAGASEWKFRRRRLIPRLPTSSERLQIEVYDAFPQPCCSRVRNTRTPAQQDFHIDRVIEQQHKFNASLAEKKAQPYDMWSFHGASYDWGKDDVIKLGRNFRSTQRDGRGGERRLWRRHPGGCVLDRRRLAKRSATWKPCR